MSGGIEPPHSRLEARPCHNRRMEKAPPSRARLWLVLGPLIVLVVAAQIGDAFAPTLAVDHPLLLIILNARNRNLVLVTNSLDALSFYTVGFFRLLASDPLFYILGFWYGDAGVKWVERKSSNAGNFLRTWEWMFQKAAWPLVAIAPNNFICLFAGAAGMAPPVFLALNVVGTAVRLYLIRVLGETFEAPLGSLLDFIRDYRIPLTAASIAIVVLTLVYDRRTGKGELEALTSIEDELGTEEDPAEEPVDDPPAEDPAPG
jgi:membrane protein DedA with SNARE-associated domain